MDKKVMECVREHYNKVIELGYECLGVFLCGSQNYKLDIEGSDVDTKAIVLPTFDDIVLNRNPISCTHVMDDNSHIDIKDIRLMFNEFKKANINFVELLFTEYMVINEKYIDQFMPVIYHREGIARYKPIAALKCAAGTAKSKYKDLENNFNPKTASTILRLEDFCMSYIDGKDYVNCIVPTNLDYIRNVKIGYNDLLNIELIKKCEYAVEHCELLRDTYERFYKSEINTEVEVLLNNVVANILSNWLKEDINNHKLTN